MSKNKKLKKIDVKIDTNVTRTYRLYQKVDGKRKYLSSFKKNFTNGTTMHLEVPDEGWTWKRDAALKVWSVTDAKALSTLLYEKLNVEESVSIEEWNW